MSGVPEGRIVLPVGHRVSLPGHFDAPVVLEHARALGADGSGGYECRIRLADGRLGEAVISAAEQAALGKLTATWRSLIEASARPLL